MTSPTPPEPPRRPRPAPRERERPMREPDQDDPLDHGTPDDPDRPTDDVWRGNTLSEPPPGA